MKAYKPNSKPGWIVRRQQDDAAEVAPAGVSVDRWGPDLTIIRSWRTPSLWLYATACVVWNAFVIFWYSISISQFNSGNPPRAAWIPILIAVPHAIGGVCLAYVTLCRFSNETRIHVTSNTIRVHHGPLPWLGNCSVSAFDLQQLFCIERSHPRKGRPRITYEVLAWQADDSFVVLLSGIEEVGQSLFIERQIERFLNLKKERVPPGFMLKP